MELDLYAKSPTPPLWKFVFGNLKVSVRPTDERRFEIQKPQYVQIPDGPYVELKEWTEGLESYPTLVIRVEPTEEIVKAAKQFIVGTTYIGISS